MGGFNANSSGGGFFFSPFSSTQTFGPFTPATDVIAFSYGAWNHLAIPVLTKRARWMRVDVSPTALLPAAYYYVQLGLGPVGSEQLWQPSNGAGLAPPPGSFVINWALAAGQCFAIPYIINIPITTPPGLEICVRCASSPAPAGTLNVDIYVFN